MGRKLFLIDGSALVYRAFFAIDNSLATSHNVPTNASYGVARMLTKFIKEHLNMDDYIAFVLDKKTVTYRHELLEKYKANRPKTPDRMVQQIPYIKRIVEALGIKVLEIENYEADDLIATLATKAKKIFDEIYILTSDKDMMQCIDGKTFILRVGYKGLTELELVDEKYVIGKYGIKPKQIPDFLALVGDPSDNIPGVKGIGPKTSSNLLKRYRTLEEIYENLDELPEKLSKTLEVGRNNAFLSKKLATLVSDIDIEIDWNDLIYKSYNRKELLKVFKELEFASLIREYQLYDEIDENINYKVVRNEEEFENLLEILRESEVISLDLETTSLSPLDAKIVGIALSTKPKSGYYIPVGHKVETKQLKVEKVLPRLLESLKGSKVIGQNLKFDYSVLYSNGYEIPNIGFDTMIAAYLLNPDQKKFGLDELSIKYLKYKPISYNELFTSGTLFEKRIEDLSIEKVSQYSIEDADIALRLYKILNEKIYSLNLEKVLNEIELPLIPVLAKMELNGVYFDEDYLRNLSSSYEKKINALLEKIYVLAGEEFNLNSPKQVSYILFEKLGIKPKKKTKTGSYSTSADSLEEMINEHEIVSLILEYRKYFKLKSTYVDALPKMINPKTQRIHTSFNQTGTATGRLSSSEPNLQNIPNRDEEGKEIRKALIPQQKGWKILSADYSQIELRILAHLSEDENLLRAFKEDLDVHSITASKIFGVPVEDVDNSMRQVGKTVNFSIIYGITPFGLSKRLKIPLKDCDKIITSYFQNYPGVRKYIESTLEKAKKEGIVYTIFGRRREVPQLRSRNKNIQQEGVRIATNTPIQGTAADIIKIAMINIDKIIREKKLTSKMILQVHDELVFEVPEKELDIMKEVVKREMENVIELKAPLKVDIKIGDHWE